MFSRQNKETAGTLISQTSPQGTSLTSSVQLLFKYLLLFEPVNVALWYVIDCSLADQTDLNA